MPLKRKKHKNRSFEKISEILYYLLVQYEAKYSRNARFQAKITHLFPIFRFENVDEWLLFQNAFAFANHFQVIFQHVSRMWLQDVFRLQYAPVNWQYQNMKIMCFHIVNIIMKWVIFSEEAGRFELKLRLSDLLRAYN